MANETHIEWLLEGETLWNEKRQAHDFSPYFAFTDIAEEFRKAGKLDHNGRVPLNRFNLSDAIFRGANLSRADFMGADLCGAKMEGALFYDTDFSQADLTNSKFGLCYLGGVDLSNAILKDTDLVGANLSGSTLTWSQFWQAKLYPDTNVAEKSVSYLKAHNGVPAVLAPEEKGLESEAPIGSAVQRIESVSGLIEQCFEIRERHQGLAIYFRGERDYKWDLRPSVMRPSNDGTFKLRAHEGEMLRDLISKRPEDFSGMTSALEQIVIAQHHRLMTRLLDISHNPCIALFSACDRRDPAGKSYKNDMDGRLHVFAVPKELIKPFDSDTVSVLANFAKLDRGYQNLLLGKRGEDIMREEPDVPLRYMYNEAMRRLYHFIRQEKPQFEENNRP